MKVTVLLFAQLAELFPSSTLEIEVTSLQEIIENLESKNPDFIGQQYSVAINEEIVQNEIALKDGDIVALLPPFAGG
ncbi:MAG: MoaD/ThiS family protein [Bacteroidetes bacterium]|nr:MoaD/ThiS family protein [Bacteroidota bacterium]